MKMKKIFLVALFILIGQFIFSQPLTNWLEFDGTNDFIDLGNSSLLKPTSALTVELWVYVENWASVDDSRFICNTESGGYSIEIQDGMTRGLVRLNGKYEVTYFDHSTLEEGWHHFALTCDGHYTELYVDGFWADVDNAGASYPLTYDSDNCTLLGAEVGSECDATGYYFNGALDDVRIWNVARTQQQIEDNMNFEVSSSSTGLVGYWKLNETSGTVAYDELVSNNGSLINMTGDEWDNSPFIESSINIADLEEFSCAWGDYDGDDDLDLVISGSDGQNPRTYLYKNNGNGSFTQIGNYLYGVSDGSVAWGDYDNDGDLDLVVSGNYSTSAEEPLSRIYKNVGTDYLQAQESAPFLITNVYMSNNSWRDYDCDGDLDLLVYGDEIIGDAKLRLYQNNNQSGFEGRYLSSSFLTARIEWGDIDKDGFPDFMFLGYTGINDPLSRIFHNKQNGKFWSYPLQESVVLGDIAFSDYNMDGHIDYFLTGINSSSEIVSKIYQCTGRAFHYRDQNINFPALFKSSGAWGDYDSDGDSDIIIAGIEDVTSDAKTYPFRNNGNNNFNLEDKIVSMQNVYYPSIAWADYDNDGDLDFLLNGLDEYDNPHSIIYNNEINIPNTKPNAPTTLSSSINNSTVKLSWSGANDNETQTKGLSYNVYMGTTSKGVDVISPMSNVLTGFRQIPSRGNADYNNRFILKNLQSGQRYYWGVQAIDNCFAGSEFSTEQMFLYGVAADEEPGYALEFDGVNDYLNCGNNSVLNVESQITVEAWIYYQGGESFPRIIDKYPAPSIYINKSNSLLGWYGEIGGTVKDFSFSNSEIPMNEWTHIAVSYDGSSVKAYVNGNLKASSSQTGALTVTTNDLIIGNSSTTARSFLGKIDEVRIWNIARNQTDIRENMHKNLDGGENGLIGYWQMNDGTGSSEAGEIAEVSNGVLNNMDINSDWVTSTIPIGAGISNTCDNFTNGTEVMGNLSLTTTNGFDNEVSLLCTEIEKSPNTTLGITGNALDRYFVLSAFGEPGTFSTNLTFTLPDGKISSDDQATPSNLKLYRRESTSDGEWTMVASATSATNNTVTFEGITSYSQFIIGSESSPLPVELISFNASIENNNIILNWQTATEVNNYGFEVERLLEPRNKNQDDEEGYTTIGFVEGHGNSSSSKSYEYIDSLNHNLLLDLNLAGESTDQILHYRLKQIDTDGTYTYYSQTASVDISPLITSIDESQLPAEFALHQNYPNPFNPTTTIQYSIPATVISNPNEMSGEKSSKISPFGRNDNVQVILKIYDILGNELATLVNEQQKPGYYEVTFNGERHASGLYIYRLIANDFVETKKMLMIK